MSVVEEFYNQKIYKVKQVHSDNSSTLYIFVGNQYDNEIYKILKKLEKVKNYQDLTLDEVKTLKSSIKNFKTKFGNLDEENIKFIKGLIYPDDSINQIRMKISYYLSYNQEYISINQQHLWIRTRNCSFKNIVNLINHLMGKDQEISQDNLVLKLSLLLDLKDQSDIEDLIRRKFPDKYKNKAKKISLFEKTFYKPEDLTENEEFKSLLTNRNIVLGREYIKNIKISSNIYLDYPLYVVANPFSDIVDYSDNVVMDQTSDQYSKTLSDYDLIDNNIIYLTTYTDFIRNYQGYNVNDIAGLYWNDLANNMTAGQIKIEKESVEHLVEKYNQIEKKYFISQSKDQNNSNVKWIEKYNLNHLVISINDANYPGSFDIEKIFNLFETSDDVPFVKYVLNDNNNQYKIYKPFLKKHSFKLKVIASWKHNHHLPDVEYPIYKKYLVFKLLLSDIKNKNLENYVSVSLYENGYTLINYNFRENLGLKTVKQKVEEISSFLHRLKKLSDSSLIHQPESNLIFKTNQSTSIIRTKILNLGLKSKLQFSNNNTTLNDLYNRMQTFYPFFYSFLKNNVLKIIYKKVNYFDSNLSVQNFVNKLFEKNKRSFDGQKNKYLETLEKIFSINRIKSKEIIESFNPQNIPENIKYHFLYGVDISISQEGKNFIIDIENLQNIQQMQFINYIFNLIFVDEFKETKDDTKSMDLDIDEEDKSMNFDMDFDDQGVDVDLGFDFDELGIDDLGLDMDLESDFKKDQKQKENEKEVEDLIIDSDIKKKGINQNKVKFTTYMAQMREKADPGLYKVEDIGNLDDKNKNEKRWKYSTTCDATQMRQPYIIPKENLDKIKDKKAITGYIKYRNNYYICPRIWDYKAEMPISVDEFIKNKEKSPYTKGEALPFEKRNKEYLGDKYNVIIRRPTSSSYWAKENVEKNWPDILKNTGSEAFPGLMKPKNHPKNLCVPCCFLKEPEDYDINSDEIQSFKKPVGYDVCDVQSESEKPRTSHDTEEFNDEITCRNENYIKTDTAVLDNCRYGQLPENLNVLLKNHQETLISNHNNSLHKYANCFLRRGVHSDKNSFFRSIASIKETLINQSFSYKKLIESIIENLDLRTFITLNEGALVSLFKYQYNLPRNRSQIHLLNDFIKTNGDFISWLGLEGLKVANGDDIMKLSKERVKFRKFKKLFTIFSAYHNFLKYCQDDKIIKRHDFFLDLFGRKLEWLFPSGANIIIFAKDTNNIFCNPYVNNPSKPIIMLLHDNNGKFEPVFHAISKGNIIPKGLIYLNHDVNMSSKNLLFLKNHLKNQLVNSNLLKDTQKRLPILKEIVKVHVNNCPELPNPKYDQYKLLPRAYTVYKELVYLADHGYPHLRPTGQITSPYHTTTYIITSGQIVFPVRPSGIILDLPVYDNLEYFDLTETIQGIGSKKSNPSQMFKPLLVFNKRTNGQLNYKPHSLIVTDQNPDSAIGIVLENGGLIPIYPMSVEELRTTASKLSLRLDVIVKNVYYEADYRIFDQQKMDDDRSVYLKEYQYFEHLYQHFKYEISSLFGQTQNNSYRNQIEKIVNVPSLEFGLIIQKLKPLIEKIAKKNIGSVLKLSDITTQSKKKYTLTKCAKLTQKKCLQHPYCQIDSKANHCYLNMESLYWMNIFINRLCEEILRNKTDRNLIIYGNYKPSFYQSEGLRLNKNEIFLTNESFYLIKQIYKSSKYHHEIDIFETVESEHVNDRVMKVPYKNIKEDSKDIGNSSTSDDTEGNTGVELTNLSGIKKKLKNVYATVFDKDGKYRSQYQAGPCIFPYIYGNTKQLFFDCNKDKDEGQRCPVEVDKNRRALKWGFCPADPKETRRKLKNKDVFAKATNNKGKIEKGFKSGKCIFPFRYHPSYDLSWECVSTKHGRGQKWCATSLKNGREVVHDLPIAADKNDRIYQKKWDWNSMYDKKNNFNDDFLRYNTRGYCPNLNKKNVKNIDQITIDNFNMNKCHQTDSKGGYSKKFLKEFATQELGISPKKLEGIKKKTLCEIIGGEITNIRTKSGLTGLNPLQIYTKDPKLCEKGESGGGYYLGTLRKMASRYFGMDPDLAKTASKKDLCNFIIPIIDNEAKRMENTRVDSSVKLSSVYLKNPYYCEEGPRKGGYTLKELKEIAITYFGVDPNINKKEDICKIIRTKLEKEREDEESFKSSFDETYQEDSLMFLQDLKSLSGISLTKKTQRNKSNKNKKGGFKRSKTLKKTKKHFKKK